jgi:peptidoglycan/LPS O-acetylase OafA/YrhL
MLMLEFGWTGVQAFFVLSGYLITGILLKDKELASSRFGYFSNFYMRRALRIFPVYFAYLAAIYLVARMTGGGLGGWISSSVESSFLYLGTYTFNFHLINSPEQGLFLAHLWSLSVEEQFYLVWPLLVLLLPRQRVLTVCVGLVALGPVIRLVEFWCAPDSRHAGPLVYFSTLSHVDAFALGALLNFAAENARVDRFVRGASKWVPVLFVLISACMLLLGRIAGYGIAASSFGWPQYLPYFHASVWGYSLLNFLFLVLIANAGASLRIKGNAVLQRLGKVSYGFYIFHAPIIMLVVIAVSPSDESLAIRDIGMAIAAFAMTWALAEASFRFLETPFLRLKRLFVAHSDAAGKDAVTPS